MALLTVPPKPPARNKRRSRSSEPKSSVTSNKDIADFQSIISESVSMSVINDEYDSSKGFKKTTKKYTAPQQPSINDNVDNSLMYPPLFFTAEDFESVTNPLMKKYNHHQLSFQKFLNTMLDMEEDHELSNITKVPNEHSNLENNLSFISENINDTDYDNNDDAVISDNINNNYSKNNNDNNNVVGPKKNKVRFHHKICHSSSIDHEDCNISNVSDVFFDVRLERLWGSFGIQIEV